jgi:hypothetical protein
MPLMPIAQEPVEVLHCYPKQNLKIVPLDSACNLGRWLRLIGDWDGNMHP